MTALNDYERLEAPALWRPDADSQRKEVIISLGDATLVISDFAGQPLAHWSLPAIERVNGTNEKTAIYATSMDSDERLETDDDTMIEAIARIHRALERGRAHPGRLRGLLVLAGVTVLLAGTIWWLPAALTRQAVSIVPDVTRADIGHKMVARIARLSGEACRGTQGIGALERLNHRLRPNIDAPLLVVDSGVPTTQHLPGGIILMNKTLVEDYDDPQVTAGFILAQQERAALIDPLERLLDQAGLFATVKLLTTGEIPAEKLDAHAETLLTAPPDGIADLDGLIARFADARIPMSPYAYALDITGRNTLPLIEADSIHIQNVEPVLSDTDWIALQGICGG